MRKNIILQWAYQILALILPIITTPYISRVFSPEKIGLYSYNYSIVSYFMLFAMLGINSYGSREIARVKDNETLKVLTFSEIFFDQMIVSLLVVGLYIVYIIAFSSNRIVSIIQAVYVIGCAFDINWYYFGLEKFDLTVFRNFACKIITLILLFTLIRSENDIYKYVAIMASGTVISQSIMWVGFRKYGSICRIVPWKAFMRLKSILVLFIPTVAISVYRHMDKIMLGSISSLAEVGYYENSEKLISLFLSFVTSMGSVMMPRISNMLSNNDEENIKRLNYRTIEVVSIISIWMVVACLSTSEYVIPLFLGDKYYGSIAVLNCLSFTIYFSSISSVLRNNILIPYKMDKMYSISVIIGALANVVLNTILIPKHGAIGAAIGTIGAEISVYLMYTYYCRDNINLHSVIIKILPSIFIGSLYFLVSRYILKFDDIILNIVSRGLLGMIMFGICWLAFFKRRDVLTNGK